MISLLTMLASPAGRHARLTVLIFHRVLARRDELMPSEPDATAFGEVLSWLASWYRVMPLDAALRQLEDGRLPARTAAITFDDGYADNAEQALPVLRAHGMSATFFVSTGFLNGGRMWNDTIIESVRRCRRLSVDLGDIGLGVWPVADLEQRKAAIEGIIGRAKYLHPSERERVVRHVRAACGEPVLPDDLMMSTAQLLRLRDAGMQVGAHTRNHPILASLADDEARTEIRSGKDDLQSLLGEEVRVFAYPNGAPGKDYESRHVHMVRDAGFEWAVSTASGAARRGGDPLQVPRFTPWDGTRLRFGARLLLNFRTPVRAVALAAET